MSYPILYSATETNFDHNGIGILSACVSCEVTEEANGIFELAMQYPMDGIHYEYISDRAIIKAKADQFRQPQLFRVYAISKPMNGIVTVLAEHISYDLSGIPVKPFSAPTVASSLMGLKTNAVVDCPFDFLTDKATQANFKVSTPASIRSRLGGVAGSILDVYGGEYEFDNYTVKLHNNRGMNRGVSIRYGKNLTDIQQDQNCSNVATGVYPYWVDSEGAVLVELPEKIINAPGTYNFVKIRTLDLSSEFETQPTIEQLRSKTQSYIKANNIGVPSVSLTVSFAQLEQTEEYKHLKLLERVSLFDTVNVEFPALGVSATAKAVKMVYDVLSNRVKSVALGSIRANIADTIVEQQKEIEKKPTVSVMQSVISNLTSSILGAKGGSVRLLDENGDGSPDTLYIADNPDTTLAVKVWRFNYEGWGASKNGYNGPFEMGATLEDGLLANFVTAAQLVAGTIKSQDSGKTFFLDLENGILKMNATEFSVSGKSVGEIAQDKLDVYAEEVEKSISDLQAQVDGQVQSWFYDYLPTTSNPPASEWTTNDQKDAHLGDLFYVVDNEEYNGMVYRWVFVNGVYKWSIVEDTQVAEALAAASKAQDTADGKRRVFVTTPTPPYDAGDLWAQGSGGDLMVCKTSKKSGSYSSSDWGLASDYIDATKAGSISQSAVSAQTQGDIFNKLTNNGTLEGIYMQNGNLYLNASYLKSGVVNADLIDVKNLVAEKLKSTSGDSAICVEDGVMFLTQNNQFSVILSNGGDGLPALSMADNVLSNGRSMLSPYKLQLGGSSFDPTFRIDCTSGSPLMKYGNINGEVLGDHVVESYFDANFSYIKYASGYAEGWGQTQLDGVAITTAWGSLYESAVHAITFPSAVDGAPYWCNLSVLDASLGVMLEVKGSPTATTSQQFFLVRGKSTASVDATIGYRVAWYWK